jgi:hypothetical protein
MHFTCQYYPVLVNPKLNCIWINIPKNASSFMQKLLQDNGWKEPDRSIVNELVLSDIRKFAVLRNPIKRWTSGFAECFMHQPGIIDLLDNQDFLKAVALNPVYDDHTELQSSFCPNLTNLEYIILHSHRSATDFYNSINQWMINEGHETDVGRWTDPVNPSSNDPFKHSINSKLKEILRTNLDFLNSIEQFYSSDLDVINKAKRISYGN